MRGQALAHMLAQFLGQRRRSQVLATEHDEGLDQFGALRVGFADHRRLDHRRVLDQCAFDIERADPVTRGSDHVVAATDEADAAVRVQLHRVAAQVVVADKGLGRRTVVAGEPAHRRLAAIDRQDPGLANGQFVVVVVQHHDAVARRSKTGGTDMHRMFEAVVVAQDHAQFGLAIMVVDHHAEVVGKPADHFRVQRFAGAADNAQLAFDATGEFVAAGNQQAVGGRRAGQVGDPVLVDHPAGAFQGKRAVVERDRVPHAQRAGHTKVDAIGPTGIGDVPESIFRAQVHGVAGVALEGDKGLERHVQGFRRAGGARGEHQQERVFTVEQHRFALIGMIGQFRPETEVAADQALALGASDRDDGRAVGHFAEFGPVRRIGHHHGRAGSAQAMFQGLGAEGGEQWLIDRADAPGSEHHDQQFDVARQQPGDLVAPLHALGLEEVGKARGLVLQVAEGVGGACAVAPLPEQGNAPGQGMPVAALDTSIECRQRTMKCRIDRVLIVEL